MTQPKIVCVIPTCRPERHAEFVKAWTPLFERHQVTLVTVWDGDAPRITVDASDSLPEQEYSPFDLPKFGGNSNVFCRHTDAVRNIGFVLAASLKPDFVLTLDDDVVPVAVPCPTCTGRGPVEVGGKTYSHCVHKGYLEETRGDGAYRNVLCPACSGTGESTNDPIQAHLDALGRRVPQSWMNTAHDTDLYLRGVPYGVRDEAPVMLSHGVWVGTPDFDGETQLYLESLHDGYEPVGVPHSLPYYVGPMPRGVRWPLSGMNVMIRREALPYFYFAPMGPDSGVDGLHRFSDIWMGIMLQRQFDALGWACYTGASTVLHTRASDARKNFEQEKLGRQWNEWLWRDDSVERGDPESAYVRYMIEYRQKRERYAALIRSIMGE